jgi:soluble lytic murein transglycosylase-like protein
MSFHLDIARKGIKSTWDALILMKARQYMVPSTVIKAHICVESEWNPEAENLADPSYGLMGIELPTARAFLPILDAKDLLEPSQNIDVGCRIIAQNITRYHGAWPDAIATYNAGKAMRDAAGYYVNHKGERNVNGYVGDVLSYLGFYLIQGPAAG